MFKKKLTNGYHLSSLNPHLLESDPIFTWTGALYIILILSLAAGLFWTGYEMGYAAALKPVI